MGLSHVTGFGLAFQYESILAAFLVTCQFFYFCYKCEYKVHFPNEASPNMSAQARMEELVKPYGMTSETYLQLVVNQHGYPGVSKGLIVLPPNTLDAAEYLRVMEVNKCQLQLEEQSEKQLVGYLENPESVPVHLRNVYFFSKGQTLHKARIEQDLCNIRNEMKARFHYLYGLAKNTRIIDGKTFEKEMRPLLIKYFEELLEQKEQEARHILEQRAV